MLQRQRIFMKALAREPYSCADIGWSESRQALIFRRRHTQQRFSVEFGADSEPQITQCPTGLTWSASNANFALRRIAGSTTEVSGSVVGFFRFISLSLCFS